VTSSGGAVLKNMGRTFLASGGTKLSSSQVYGRNVDPRLLRAYLPKEKRWHEPRDKKVDDDEVDTKKAPTAPSVKDEPPPAAPIVKKEAIKSEDIGLNIDYDNISRTQINDMLKPRLESIEQMSAKKQSARKKVKESGKTMSKELFPKRPGSPFVKKKRRSRPKRHWQ
jgi:hypothetical protein